VSNEDNNSASSTSEDSEASNNESNCEVYELDISRDAYIVGYFTLGLVLCALA